ncbi:Mitochondrial inner membrane protein oxa1 [Tulasnella sp. 408]|nr:Mitochondrial inner membrane protein oxa1 [Tulasnella sp. 408]
MALGKAFLPLRTSGSLRLIQRSPLSRLGSPNVLPSSRLLSTRPKHPPLPRNLRPLSINVPAVRWASTSQAVPAAVPPITAEPPIASTATTAEASALPPPELYKATSDLPSPADVVAPTTTPATSSVPPVPSDASIGDLVTSPLANGDHIGDLASLGLGGWSPAGLVQTLLEQIHVHTGMPWWATIISLAAVVRISMLPIHIRVTANNTRMAYITPKVKEATEAIQKAKENKDQAELMKAAMQMRQLYATAGASPLVGMLGLVQVPVALGMFFGVKWMCNLPVESMTTGGLAWFTDLTAADPTYVLPAVSTAAIIAMLRLSSADTPKTPETAHMSNGFTILSLIGFPFLANLPAGVMIYFISNGALQAVQAAIFRIKSIRERVGFLPPPPHANTVPSPTMVETLKAGYNKLINFNKNRFEEIKRDAYERAEKDVKRRAAESARQAAKSSATRQAAKTPKQQLTGSSKKHAKA